MREESEGLGHLAWVAQLRVRQAAPLDDIEPLAREPVAGQQHFSVEVEDDAGEVIVLFCPHREILEQGDALEEWAGHRGEQRGEVGAQTKGRLPVIPAMRARQVCPRPDQRLPEEGGELLLPERALHQIGEQFLDEQGESYSVVGLV